MAEGVRECPEGREDDPDAPAVDGTARCPSSLVRAPDFLSSGYEETPFFSLLVLEEGGWECESS